MTPQPYRREILRTGATVATVGAAIALSGCQEAVNRVIEGEQLDSLETVRTWTPAPPEDGPGSEWNRAMFPVKYRRPKVLTKVDDRTETDLTRWSRDSFSRWIEALPVPYAEVPYVLYLGPMTGVLRYDHDPDEFASTLEADVFRKRSTHRGFEVYVSPAPGDAESNRETPYKGMYAFDGKHVVRSVQPVVERIIDANAGAVDRYVETNDHAETMLRVANSGALLEIHRDGPVSPFGPLRGRTRLDQHVGYCLTGRFGSEFAACQLLVAFETSDETAVDTVKGFVEAHRDDDNGFRHAETLEYDRSGHVVEVEFRIPLDEFPGPS